MVDRRLQRVTLHECRHGYASLAIAAGLNAKALSTYMGDASITETMDGDGHLLPANEHEAAGLMDDYLSAATTYARRARRATVHTLKPAVRSGFASGPNGSMARYSGDVPRPYGNQLL